MKKRWKVALAVSAGLGSLAAGAPLAGPAGAAGSGGGGADVPMVTLGDARVVEGDAGRRVAKVPITLSRSMDSAAYFTVRTVDGDKLATPGSDYKPVAKPVRIPAGATYKTVGIPIYGDTEAEDFELVQLEITRLDAPTVGFNKATGFVGIDDDDADGGPGAAVSVSSVRMFEGNPIGQDVWSQHKVQLTLSLSQAQATDVFVTWHTESVAATPGADFKPVASKTTRIPAGKLQKTILVTVYGDPGVESDEDVNVILDSVTGADVAVGLGRGLVLVVDDDRDDDGDGLVDSAEGYYKTDPGSADTDGDSLTDLDEVVLTGTNPNQADTDADGLEDLVEIKVHATDPNLADTDGDGWDDGTEVAVGSDPLDPTDHPV